MTPPKLSKTDEPLAIGEVVQSPDGATYRVIRRIGAGGYSVVYEVVEEKSGQRFAMKVLQLARANDRVSIERAKREGPVLFLLKHPNVVRAHAYGVRNDGMIWLVLDLFVGRTLRELQLAMGGKIPVPLLLAIVAQVCAGLTAIHNLQLVHRDIKPENIHVDRGGELVRLFDLGVVKGDPTALKTTGGFTVGTVAYMSPEQVLATSDVDAASDLFSLGILLYELLSGVHPFCDGPLGSAFRQEIGQKILYAEPVPIQVVAPFVPKTLQQIVTRCLRKKRSERYASSTILARLLAATTKDYLATHPSVSLKDTMEFLDRQSPVTGDVPALQEFPNPFLLSSGAPRRLGDPAFASTDRANPSVAPLDPEGRLATFVNPEPRPALSASVSEPQAAASMPVSEPEPPTGSPPSLESEPQAAVSAPVSESERRAASTPDVKPAAVPLRALEVPTEAPKSTVRMNVPLPAAARARTLERTRRARRPASNARFGRRAVLVVVATVALVLIIGGTVLSFSRRPHPEAHEAAPVSTKGPIAGQPPAPILPSTAIVPVTTTAVLSPPPPGSASASPTSPPPSVAAPTKAKAPANASGQTPAIRLPF